MTKYLIVSKVNVLTLQQFFVQMAENYIFANFRKLHKNKKMERVFFFATFLCVFNLSLGHSQQALATSGDDASGNGGTVSYSVGQVVFSYAVVPTGSVEQGVQHAYEIYPVGTNNIVNPNFVVSVFPNPTDDILNLEVEHLDNKKMTYRLINSGGNLLENKPIDTMKTQIRMGSLPSATYFVEIYQGSRHIQSFKIIKNKA